MTTRNAYDADYPESHFNPAGYSSWDEGATQQWVDDNYAALAGNNTFRAYCYFNLGLGWSGGALNTDGSLTLTNENNESVTIDHALLTLYETRHAELVAHLLLTDASLNTLHEHGLLTDASLNLVDTRLNTLEAYDAAQTVRNMSYDVSFNAVDTRLSAVDTELARLDTVKSDETYVDASVLAMKNNILGGAGPAYDTLLELQTELVNNETLVSQLVNSVADYAADAVAATEYVTQVGADLAAAVAAATDTNTTISALRTEFDTYSDAFDTWQGSTNATLATHTTQIGGLNTTLANHLVSYTLWKEDVNDTLVELRDYDTATATAMGLQFDLVDASFNAVDTRLGTLESYDTAQTSRNAGYDAAFVSVSNSLGLLAPKANPTFTGTVSGVTKTHVGLGSVDNTSDANKPVSTAVASALALKANLSGATFSGAVTMPSLTVGGGVAAASGVFSGGVSANHATLAGSLTASSANITNTASAYLFDSNYLHTRHDHKYFDGIVDPTNTTEYTTVQSFNKQLVAINRSTAGYSWRYLNLDTSVQTEYLALLANECRVRLPLTAPSAIVAGALSAASAAFSAALSAAGASFASMVVSGASALGSITVSGATSLASLAVSGLSALHAVTCTTLAASGDVSCAAALGVAGDTTLHATSATTLSVSGDTTLTGQLNTSTIECVTVHATDVRLHANGYTLHGDTSGNLTLVPTTNGANIQLQCKSASDGNVYTTCTFSLLESNITNHCVIPQKLSSTGESRLSNVTHFEPAGFLSLPPETGLCYDWGVGALLISDVGQEWIRWSYRILPAPVLNNTHTLVLFPGYAVVAYDVRYDQPGVLESYNVDSRGYPAVLGGGSGDIGLFGEYYDKLDQSGTNISTAPVVIRLRSWHSWNIYSLRLFRYYNNLREEMYLEGISNL